MQGNKVDITQVEGWVIRGLQRLERELILCLGLIPEYRTIFTSWWHTKLHQAAVLGLCSAGVMQSWGHAGPHSPVLHVLLDGCCSKQAQP